MHTNFCLSMIIPQSFQFVGQMVRLLLSLQNVFQMTFLTLQAACEIAKDRKVFLHGDCSDPYCNCCLQVTDYLGVVFVYSVPKVNIWGVNRVRVAPGCVSL